MKRIELKRSESQLLRSKSLLIFFILSLFLGLILLSCSDPSFQNKTVVLPSCFVTNKRAQLLDTLPENVKPIYGYRFMISGDFDGDGKQENLIEHYHSGLTRKETNKFYSNLEDLENLVALTIANQPYSFLLSTNKSIDTLHVSSNEQLLGISYLKNEGDLNDDGNDEISFVKDYADWSSMNTWIIMTYKNKQWIELCSFEIRDWQLPEIPYGNNQYGLFGVDKKNVTINWKENRKIEKEMLAFEGLVRKVKSNQIEITCMDQEATLVTKVVNLKKILSFTDSPPKAKNERFF